MEFGLSEAQGDFVASMRAFLDEHFPESGNEPFGEGAPGYHRAGSFLTDEFLDWLRFEHDVDACLHEGGLVGGDWPVEYGGRGRSAFEHFLLLDELAYRHLPDGGPSARTVGRSLMRFGTPGQQQRYLPRILTGEFVFALGWTEPEAGSDLSSLRTRATRNGAGDFVVYGQKMYTTYAHRATHLWLAVRTDPRAKSNEGISILIAPTDLPGVEIRDLPVVGGERTNEVFLDHVVVPAENLVGTENAGWTVMGAATAYERMQGLGDVVRLVEFLADWLRTVKEADPFDIETAWRQVGELSADLEVGRSLASTAAVCLEEGADPSVFAAAAKTWLTELRVRIAASALEIAAVLGRGRDEDRAIRELFEGSYLYSPLRRFAGGTNQVLRDLVAQRGLGLPATTARRSP